MKVPSQVRKLFLASPANYRRAIITDNQICVLNLIESMGSLSASELAMIRGAPVKNASKQLRRLADKGYLVATERNDPTGGIYYRYRVAHAIHSVTARESSSDG